MLKMVPCKQIMIMYYTAVSLLASSFVMVYSIEHPPAQSNTISNTNKVATLMSLSPEEELMFWERALSMSHSMPHSRSRSRSRSRRNLRIKLQQRSGKKAAMTLDEEIGTGSPRQLDILYDLDEELYLESERRRVKSALRARKKQNSGNHNNANHQDAPAPHEYHRRQLNEFRVEEDLLFWER
jgi:hypothetical protein